VKIGYMVQDPDKAYALRVGLRYEKAIDGEDKINEVPCRKARLVSLGPIAPPYNAQQLAYAQECEKWHHKRDAAVRAKWDADDKATADAAAAAAKAAEEAKFIVTAHSVKKGMVSVTIVHHGLTVRGNVAKGADKAEFEQNCRVAFAAFETVVNAEKDELAALAIIA